MITREALARFGGDTPSREKPAVSGRFDMDGYLTEHGFAVRRQKSWGALPGGLI